MFDSMLESFFSFLQKNKNEIAIAAGSALAGGLVASILTSNYKDRAYEELIKKHDRETAKRLSAEFNRKLEELEKRHSDNEKKLRDSIIRLCYEMGIPPSAVLK